MIDIFIIALAIFRIYIRETQKVKNDFTEAKKASKNGDNK